MQRLLAVNADDHLAHLFRSGVNRAYPGIFSFSNQGTVRVNSTDPSIKYLSGAFL